MLTIDRSDFKALKAKVERNINDEVSFAARYTTYRVIDDIVFRAPVKSGSYVMGHRLGRDVEDNTPPVIALKHLSPRIRTLTKLRLKARAFNFPKNKKIIISNRVPYNTNIEYTGWTNVPPYGTFTFAREQALFTVQQQCYIASQKIALGL